MTKQIITITCCAAGLVLSAFGQNPSSTTPGASTDQQSTSPAGSSSLDNSTRRWPTGRMGQATRASQLMNAEVKSSQGQTLGTVNDLVLNPSSGRIDFAVVTINSSASSISTTTPTSPTSTTSPTDSTSSAATSGKLVAVPWMLLRPSASSTSVSGVSAGTAGQQSFLFAGDATKLLSAPAFEQSNWPDITQYSWKQSIYSHFGMTPGSSSTGGATSPGGTGSSTGSSPTPGSSSSSIPPSSQPSSPDDSSGK